MRARNVPPRGSRVGGRLPHLRRGELRKRVGPTTRWGVGSSPPQTPAAWGRPARPPGLASGPHHAPPAPPDVVRVQHARFPPSFAVMAAEMIPFWAVVIYVIVRLTRGTSSVTQRKSQPAAPAE